MGDGVIVRHVDGVAGLYATRTWQAGEVVLLLDGITQGYPSRYSVQVAATEHLMPPLRAVVDGDIEDYYRWCFLNHACEPSVRVDTDTPSIVALVDLAPGDELRFDYETTEWNMAEPFYCFCQARTCRHHIRGFKYLTHAQRAALATPPAPFLCELLGELGAPELGPVDAD